jgi:hypothetical protein
MFLRVFWQRDNSLGHIVMGICVIRMKVKLKSNIPKIQNFKIWKTTIPNMIFCFLIFLISKYYISNCGSGSSVGIPTDYRLGGSGIESQWGRDLSHTSRPALGPTQPPVQWVLGFYAGKAAGAWCWPPTPSSAEVELTPPLGPWWPVIGWTLHLLHF